MGCFSCSALGAICENLVKCECGFFSIGSICNCSKTQTIIIPQQSGTALASPDVAATLKETIYKLNPQGTAQLVMSATVRQIKIPAGDAGEYVDQSIHAIYLIGLCTISRWLKKSDNYTEHWARFESAYRQAKVNLDEHISERKPLLAKELKRLNEKIEEVERFGSLAADLLEKVCTCKGNWKLLQDTANVAAGACKSLSKKFISADFKTPLLFSELMYSTQAVFIKAVKKNYSKDYVRERGNDFTAWVRPQNEERKTREGEEGKGSPLAEVHHRLNEHFTPSKAKRSREQSPVTLVQHLTPPHKEEESLLTEKHFDFRVEKPDPSQTIESSTEVKTSSRDSSRTSSRSPQAKHERPPPHRPRSRGRGSHRRARGPQNLQVRHTQGRRQST